jgi:hypothetical protein
VSVLPEAVHALPADGERFINDPAIAASIEHKEVR